MKRGNWTDEHCFYVSVKDGEKFALVLGPFRTEAECRAWAYSAPEDGGDISKHGYLLDRAQARDAKSWFYAWGMVKWADGHREGVLNKAVLEDRKGN